MNIQDVIKRRRTIKPLFFTGEKILDTDVNEMLDCANWAPTHKLTEPWRFVVFSENAKTILGKDHAEMYKDVTPTNEFNQKKYDKLIRITNNSSHVITIIMQRDEDERVREIEEIAAVSCAVQNMMLVATEKGIANIWSTGGLTYHDKMREYLGFKDKDKIMGFLYLGVSNFKTNPRRLSSINEKMKWLK